MNAFKEKWIGLLVYGGCGTALLCGFGSWFLAVGLGVSGIRFGTDSKLLNGVLYLGMALTVAGVIAMVIGIGSGLLASSREFRGDRKIVPNARVVARYALDRDGTMFTDDYGIANLDRPKFFVRLDIGTGMNDEYECAEPVFWEAGEGMVGEAELQGKWLGMFKPAFGPSQGRQDGSVPSL